ncbi:MAG: hypothetical protein AAFQ55_15800, partial [Pseudomonadota bacterium]
MNIDMIRSAAARLKGHAQRTPLLSSDFINEKAGRRVWIKPECLHLLHPSVQGRNRFGFVQEGDMAP